MMRSNGRKNVIGAIQEEDHRSQFGASGGVPIASNNKLRAPVVRRQSLDVNQSEAGGNTRQLNPSQEKIKGIYNGQAKPILKGSSSFMGSNRNPAPIKKEDPKPIVYINKPNVPSRLSGTTTAKGLNGVNSTSKDIGTVSKVLGNSNKKDYGGIITKPTKATIVDDHSRGGGLDSIGNVTRILSNSNRPSNITKANQRSSMANKIIYNNKPQHCDDGIANVGDEQQYVGSVSNSNHKENNVAHMQAHNMSDVDQLTSLQKEQSKSDLHIIVGESSSPRSTKEVQSKELQKLSPPQPHPEVRGRPPPQDYLMQEWMRGPSNPEGQFVNVSDQPSLCMSINGNEACIGSSDHALYIVDCQKCTFVRALYGKQYGHTEWVTCCDYLQDGRILSGGMDGKLCLWDKKGVRAIDLKGHMASISAVKGGVDSSLAVSASYDKTLMLWNVNRLQTKAAGCLRGHKGAVLGFCLSSQRAIVSGSRDGDVILWDTTRATPFLHITNAHEGHVTAIECLEDTKNKTWEECREVYMTGGQDGILQVWDFRKRGPIYSAPLHRNAVEKGAINNIGVSYTACGGGPIVITAGADNLIKVLEPRCGYKVLHTIASHHDFIYSLYVAGPLVWSGSGDGSVLVHELMTGQCLYGLGADSKGAVRCISLAGPNCFVAAGDDGNVMIYSVGFPSM